MGKIVWLQAGYQLNYYPYRERSAVFRYQGCGGTFRNTGFVSITAKARVGLCILLIEAVFASPLGDFSRLQAF
jgi:hypothetical protein